MSEKRRKDSLPLSDACEILGVSSGASASEVKKAYYALVRKYHPDVNPDPRAQNQIKAITHAYDVVSNAIRNGDGVIPATAPTYAAQRPDTDAYNYDRAAAFQAYEARVNRNRGIRARIGAVAAAGGAIFFGVTTAQVMMDEIYVVPEVKTPFITGMLAVAGLGFALMATVKEISARDAFRKAAGVGEPVTPSSETPQAQPHPGPPQQPNPEPETRPYNFNPAGTVEANAGQPPLEWYSPSITPEGFRP